MRLALVSPDDIAPNRNWKDHPEVQIEALESALKKLGWTIPVIANENTKRIIDGHLRVELARQNNWSLIPVVFVSLTEEQEAAALIALDSIRSLAKADMNSLSTLLDTIQALGAGDLIDGVIPDFLKETADAALPFAVDSSAETDVEENLVAVRLSPPDAQALEQIRFRHCRNLSSEHLILAIAEIAPCQCSI